MISPEPNGTGKTEMGLFPLGQLMATPGALALLSDEEIKRSVRMHLSGDWGDLSKEDWLANDRSLKDGTRLLSAYRSERGAKFWIITEADRSVTTILLPEEY